MQVTRACRMRAISARTWRRLGACPRLSRLAISGTRRRCPPAAGATGPGRRRSSAPGRPWPRPARRAWRPGCRGTAPSNSIRSLICGSRSAVSKKYRPRSCTQSGPVGAADRVGRVEHRVLRLQQPHFGVLVGHALAADLAGIRAVLRVVELELVVVDDDRAAGLRVVDQPLVVGAQIGAALVGAHAGHDRRRTSTGRPTPARRASISVDAATPSCSSAAGTSSPTPIT